MNSEKLKDDFIDYLKKNNHRITPERLLVFENIIMQTGHIEADNLFVTMKSKGLKVSRATVYNTLQILISARILSRSNFGESHQHYEKATEPHHHLVCSECGNVSEFENKSLDDLQKRICKAHEFQSESYVFQITGICHKCLKKK